MKKKDTAEAIVRDLAKRKCRLYEGHGIWRVSPENDLIRRARALVQTAALRGGEDTCPDCKQKEG